jgi:hypothetical protein
MHVFIAIVIKSRDRDHGIPLGIRLHLDLRSDIQSIRKSYICCLNKK